MPALGVFIGTFWRLDIFDSHGDGPALGGEDYGVVFSFDGFVDMEFETSFVGFPLLTGATYWLNQDWCASWYELRGFNSSGEFRRGTRPLRPSLGGGASPIESVGGSVRFR